MNECWVNRPSPRLMLHEDLGLPLTLPSDAPYAFWLGAYHSTDYWVKAEAQMQVEVGMQQFLGNPLDSTRLWNNS